MRSAPFIHRIVILCYKLSLSKKLLNVLNRLLENLLLELGVLEVLLDLGDDGLGQELLLSLSDRVLVSNPRVKNRLGLSGKSNLLLGLENLSLELDGVLGDSEKVLGGLDNILELVDVTDSLLDGVGVLVSGGVEDVSHVLNVTVSPRGVAGATELGNDNNEGSEDTENDRLIVDNVQLVGDGVDGSEDTGSEDTSLGQDVVTGDGVQDGGGLSLGVNLVGVVSAGLVRLVVGVVAVEVVIEVVIDVEMVVMSWSNQSQLNE